MGSFTKKFLCFLSCVASQVLAHVGSNISVNCITFILFIRHYYSYALLLVNFIG